MSDLVPIKIASRTIYAFDLSSHQMKIDDHDFFCIDTSREKGTSDLTIKGGTVIPYKIVRKDLKGSAGQLVELDKIDNFNIDLAIKEYHKHIHDGYEPMPKINFNTKVLVMLP